MSTTVKDRKRKEVAFLFLRFFLELLWVKKKLFLGSRLAMPYSCASIE